jgi:hypothetical protein
MVRLFYFARVALCAVRFAHTCTAASRLFGTHFVRRYYRSRLRAFGALRGVLCLRVLNLEGLKDLLCFWARFLGGEAG